MVPGEFLAFFAAAGTAAGALIGLLFVAVTLRPESVLGDKADPAAQAVAGSAFTALVNSFFVSLIAVIPDTSLGYTAAVFALLSLYNTVRMHLRLAGHESPWPQLAATIATYLAQLGVGLALAIRPHERIFVYVVAYLLVASFAVALRRAWSLMQGRSATTVEHERKAA